MFSLCKTAMASPTIAADFVGGFDENLPALIGGSPEVKELIKEQLANITKFISYGNKVGMFKTVVICPVSGATYNISLLPS